MFWYKCKNSVFCVFFLICFFIGTICGAFIFRVLYRLHSAWIVSYSTDLLMGRSVGFFSLLLCFLRPSVLVLVSGSLSFGRRLIPLLVIFRGCCVSYFLCTAFCAGCHISSILMTELMGLMIFFCVCRFVVLFHDGAATLPVFNWQLVLFALCAAAFTAVFQYCVL